MLSLRGGGPARSGQARARLDALLSSWRRRSALGLDRGTRRRLRAAAASHPPGALPEGLRERLLAIPLAVGAPSLPEPALRPRPLLSWLADSPVTPLAAGFVLAVGLGLLGGNPYRLGASTVDEMQREAAPAAIRLRLQLASFGGAALELGEAAAGAVPRAGLRASRAITTLASTLERAGVERDAATPRSTPPSSAPGSPTRPARGPARTF